MTPEHCPCCGQIITTTVTRKVDELNAFEHFWKVYPRKVGKDAARRSWLRRKLVALLPEIIKSVENYKQSDAWSRDGGQYIPHPTTWLNQGRWQDEIKAGPPRVLTLQEKIELENNRKLKRDCPEEYAEAVREGLIADV